MTPEHHPEQPTENRSEYRAEQRAEERKSSGSTALPAGMPAAIGWAIEAARSKLASQVTLLDLRGLGSFTDAFVLCSGGSPRQVQAITDAIEEALDRPGLRLWHREGYEGAEWVLLDYGFFVVHVFHERARHFYDLERLWRPARRMNIPDDYSKYNAKQDGAAKE